MASLDLTLSERKGLTVCQNFLLSVMSFSFNLAKYSFFSFLRRETIISLFFIEQFILVVRIIEKFVSKACSLHDSF